MTMISLNKNDPSQIDNANDYPENCTISPKIKSNVKSMSSSYNAVQRHPIVRIK